VIKLRAIHEVLGIPSTHKILETLAVWGELTVDEIIEKTKLSRNQVYNVLKLLIENGFVEKVNRGKYKLASNPRTKHLAMFYKESIIMQIGSYLQSIIEEREEVGPEELTEIIEKYEPILKEHFKWIMHSLVEMNLID